GGDAGDRRPALRPGDRPLPHDRGPAGPGGSHAPERDFRAAEPRGVEAAPAAPRGVAPGLPGPGLSARMHYEDRRGEFLLSTDPGLIDAREVHAFLTQSYWAAGIPLEV